MFQIKGPIFTAMDLDKGSDELLRQADALARSYKVKPSICHVLPEIFAVRPFYPQPQLDDALMLSELEAAVRDALLNRIRTLTAREPHQIDRNRAQEPAGRAATIGAHCPNGTALKLMHHPQVAASGDRNAY
jgi:hypothetical protein